MTETKSKKLRIYKYASEINLSADQILEFLVKKGHPVKTIQSMLTDEMIEEINNHFKKDIEKTEKHNKKIAEIIKKKVDRVEKKEEPATPVVEVEERVEEEIEAISQAEPEIEIDQQIENDFEEVTEPEIEIVEEEVTVVNELIHTDEVLTHVVDIQSDSDKDVEEVVISDEAIEQAREEIKIEEEKVEEVLAAANETEVTADLPVVEDTVEEKAEPIVRSRTFLSPKDTEAGKRKGLTILGKIDLTEKKKVEKKPEEKKKFEHKKPGQQQRPFQDRNSNVRSLDGVTSKLTEKVSNVPGSTNQTSAESEAAKKKKKPKIKKKPDTVPAPVEDTPIVKKKKKVKKFEIDQKEVKETIRKTLLSMDDAGMSDRAKFRNKKKKEREAEEERRLEQKAIDEKVIKVTEYIAVNELANLMGVSVGEVIGKCISLGIMVSINQRLDVDTITLVADEFGFEVEFQDEYTSDALENTADDPETEFPRSPVVTIMGHVDHGKTSLLDHIRRENVVAGESGGITQHIGAYKVDVGNGKYITFLDTPGHEAFTAMRARGAKLTDIVVLVVAADDAVMPQTIEAINHAQAANVPIVIAINKIDKPGANLEKIKQQLGERNILVEDWGGKYQCVELSAKTGFNVDLLLEKILLEADLLDLKASSDRMARGVVIESELDKGRGITGTILVQKGTLKIGDPFVAGVNHGKVRAMFDERNNRVQEAGPSTPVLVLGFEGAPQAGDTFVVVESDRYAREISLKRSQLKREQDQKQIHHITLDEIAKQISIGGVKELPIIVKGDVDGSIEAISDSLMKLSNEEVIVRVIHKGVGSISESDVLLAAASNAIIVGFHVRPNINARKLAEAQKVDIRLYNVIYDIINEIKSALEGLLSPVVSEEITSTVEIRDTFKVPKFGTVAGCYVLEGKITRNSKVRLVRDGIVIHEGEIGSLKRYKDDVKEVDAGHECGLNLANFNDIKVGDIIESYKMIETKKKLE